MPADETTGTSQFGKHLITHGHCRAGHKNPAYAVWAFMIQRCTNPNRGDYKHYGGRGITVCDRWLHSFPNFLEDMGERPSGLTLERIDNNKGYGPDNCKWVTRREQTRNTRGNNMITIGGVTQCLKSWCEHYKMSYSTVKKRLHIYHWPVEKIFNTPRKLSPARDKNHAPD